MATKSSNTDHLELKLMKILVQDMGSTIESDVVINLSLHHLTTLLPSNLDLARMEVMTSLSRTILMVSSTLGL